VLITRNDVQRTLVNTVRRRVHTRAHTRAHRCKIVNFIWLRARPGRPGGLADRFEYTRRVYRVRECRETAVAKRISLRVYVRNNVYNVRDQTTIVLTGRSGLRAPFEKNERKIITIDETSFGKDAFYVFRSPRRRTSCSKESSNEPCRDSRVRSSAEEEIFAETRREINEARASGTNARISEKRKNRHTVDVPNATKNGEN